MKPGGDGTNSGNEHKEPPQTVDHTGNGRQELDNVLEHELELGGKKILGKENGNGNAKEPAEYQRQQRTVQRAPNFRQHAELSFVDIPGCRGEKIQPVLLY